MREAILTRWKLGGFRLDEELSRNWLLWAMVFWACTAVWFLVARQANIYWLVLGDTDDNMRLMQVRAWLAGQGWYDMTQYRLDPANGGFNIHWSRIPDLPIAALILALKPFLGVAQAERWACGIAPLLPLALTMTGLALTVRRLVAPHAWPVALLILLSCGSTLAMYMPMRVDHHNWQLAALALTVAGLADAKGARGGATVGFFSAFSLAIGLEMLPYIAMAGAIIALRWVWDAAEARRMMAYGLTLAGGSAAGFVAFTSTLNYAMRCDALTPVWLSVVTGAGALLVALALASPSNRLVRLALGVVAGGSVVAGFVLMFPQCLGRPEGVSDELANVWLNNVREARPIYRQTLEAAFPMATLPLIGIVGACVATWRARGTHVAVGWAAIALFTAFAGVMLLWQIRAAPAAQLLSVPGSVALIWFIVPWCMKLRWMPARILGVTAAILLASGLFAGLVLRYLPKSNTSASGSSAVVRKANGACSRLSSMQMLSGVPKGIMFTHVDLGPRLIATTKHDGLAGPYHRNGQAILDVHHAFTGKTADFRTIAARHKADYLLICPNMSETTLYRSRAPKGFYAELHQGKAPNWLEPVTLSEKAPYKLWKIRYDLP